MPRFEVSNETYELVKVAAGKRGLSMTALVNKVLASSLGVKDTVPVLLSVPKSLTKDEDGLRSWLVSRSEGLVQQLCRKDLKKNVAESEAG